MRIDRLTVRRYRQLKDVDIRFGDLTLLVGPNGSGKSTILRALEFGIAGPFASEFAITNGSPDLIGQLVREGLSDVTVTLTLSEDELASCRGILGSPWPDANDPKPNVLVLKRELVPNQNKVIEVRSTVSTASGDRSLPEHATTIQDAFFKLNQWISKKAPLIVPAERRLGWAALQDGISIVPDGGTLLYRLYESAGVRSRGNNPLFKNLTKHLRSILPTFSTFTAVLRNAMYDLEFDDLPGLWMGSGYKEVVTVLGETLGSTAPIVSIEEIERGMHPGLIPTFLDAIREVAMPRQVILTTHSASVVSAAPVAALWEVTSSCEVRQVNRTSLEGVAKGLGIRPGDVLDHDLLLLVEGPGDEGAWNGWLKQEKLASQCAAIEVGGFGKARHYTNEAFIKHRVRRPIVCVLFDGDVRKKTGGTTVLKDAIAFAIANDGVAFDLTQDMLEDYLLQSPKAIGKATRKSLPTVQDAIEQARKTLARPGKELTAKAILEEAWYRLTGQRFRRVDDAILIASKISSKALPDELKAVIHKIKTLLKGRRKHHV